VKGLAEAALAGMAAVALHLAAFAMVPAADGGASAAGEDGAALVSLAPADAALAALIAAWDRPPAPPAPRAESALVAPEALPPATPGPEFPVPVAQAQVSSDTPLMADLVPLPMVAPEPPLPPEPALEPVTEPPEPEVQASLAPDTSARPKRRPASPLATPVAQPAETKPAAPRAQGSAPAQKAAGSGNTGAAGDGRTGRAATLSQSEVSNLQAGWGATIRASVERRKAYPRGGAGARGAVTLRLSVGPDGRLQQVGVAQSSGHPELDAAALRAVRAAGRFAPAPKGVPQTATGFTLTMRFSP